MKKYFKFIIGLLAVSCTSLLVLATILLYVDSPVSGENTLHIFSVVFMFEGLIAFCAYELGTVSNE